MFDEQFVDDNHNKQRCEDCEYKRLVHASGGFSFNGCYHRPYIGKWVANIKDCPKEMESDEMPTLDELIAQECKTAEHNHNMYEYECSFYGKKVVDSEEKMDCVKEYEYHSQIAELLEELKARREADRISDSKPFDVLLVQRYTKAIDDFAKELCKAFDETTLNDDGYYPNNVVRSIAEQLKAGGESE